MFQFTITPKITRAVRAFLPPLTATCSHPSSRRGYTARQDPYPEHLEDQRLARTEHHLSSLSATWRRTRARHGRLAQVNAVAAAQLTDSGGFQVFSLSQTRKIDDEGVTFKSHIDGSTHRFTPEKSITIQENLGADIIMAFDECSDPNDKAYSAIAMHRTHRWAERSLKAQTRSDQALFGIIQGGVQADLRVASAKFIASLDTPGIAIGGLSVGETKQEMHDALDVLETNCRKQTSLPDGSRNPEDLINGVARGIDYSERLRPPRVIIQHQPRRTAQPENATFARDELP